MKRGEGRKGYTIWITIFLKENEKIVADRFLGNLKLFQSKRGKDRRIEKRKVCVCVGVCVMGGDGPRRRQKK